MKPEDIRKIAVIGAGDMGHGIAELTLLNGYRVAMCDIKQEFVDKGLKRIKESFEKLVEKHRISKDNVKAMLGNIETFVDISDTVRDADFVVEAVSEIMKDKKQIFQKLDDLAQRHAVIASNTSTMSITDIALATSRPEKVIGMHFFNPVVIMKLVEVIKGEKTNEEAMQLTYDLAIKMGKVPVRIEKDSPGFIYNRIQAASTIMLGLILDRKLANPEEIDAKLAKIGLPIGPYAAMDYAGLDVTYNGLLYLAKKLSTEYGPPKWLKERVAAGETGRKARKGIYDWSKGKYELDSSKAEGDFDVNDFIAIQLNEATKLLEAGVANSMDDIDKVIINGGGVASGLSRLAQTVGYAKLAHKCEELAKKFGIEAFKPTETLKKWSGKTKMRN
jgi:enoyl-CoA hydratase/3-hydroxyacyl-CoA dehydrogenase